MAIGDWPVHYSIVQKMLSEMPECFPNLRSFQLNNKPQLQVVGLDGAGYPKIMRALLFDFLRKCRGLTELRLHNSRLDQDAYDQLSELYSLASLRKLTLFEDFEMNYLPGRDRPIPVPGYSRYQPTEPLLCRFLSKFKFLRLFRTNLTTRVLMQDAIRKMRVDTEYQFRFWNSKRIIKKDLCTQFTIVRTDESHYDLSISSVDREDAFYTHHSSEPAEFSKLKLFALINRLNHSENIRNTSYAWRLPSVEPMDVD